MITDLFLLPHSGGQFSGPAPVQYTTPHLTPYDAETMVMISLLPRAGLLVGFGPTQSACSNSTVKHEIHAGEQRDSQQQVCFQCRGAHLARAHTHTHTRARMRHRLPTACQMMPFLPIFGQVPYAPIPTRWPTSAIIGGASRGGAGEHN